MPTHTERVIATLRRSPGLNDAELALESGVEIRELTRICHYLELLNWLRRTPGPDGKIINILIVHRPASLPRSRHPGRLVHVDHRRHFTSELCGGNA